MQRREALKTMGAGAVALATGSLPITTPASPIKFAPASDVDFAKIDDNYQWKISFCKKDVLYWVAHTDKLSIRIDSDNVYKFVAIPNSICFHKLNDLHTNIPDELWLYKGQPSYQSYQSDHFCVEIIRSLKPLST